MRAAILFAASAILAHPAVAQRQPFFGLTRDAVLTAQVASARQRDVAVTNERSAQDARSSTDQALRDVQATQARPAMPAVLAPLPSSTSQPLRSDPMPPVSTSSVSVPAFVSIPDDRLAASSAAARAASRNCR
jgi:hypothetical protein